MYDINTKNVKKGKNFYLIFLVIGLLILLIMGGVLISSYIKLNSLDATTTSTKVVVNSHLDDEGKTLYSPTYYYIVDGNEYSCSSNSSSSINPGTNNKKVYYDSKNPSKCMTEYSKSSNNIFLIFMLIPLIFIVFAIINMRKISKRIKLINELNSKGKLIKNLPYRLENTGMSVNNIPIQRPVVDYTLASGSTITLYGDPRHDHKSTDADGMVDLVIDESNPDNYFIDFEINRLTGNLPSDYFTGMTNNEFQSNNAYYQTNTQYPNIPNNELNTMTNNMVDNFQQNQPTVQQNAQFQSQMTQNMNQQTDINQSNNIQNNNQN